MISRSLRNRNVTLVRLDRSENQKTHKAPLEKKIVLLVEGSEELEAA